VAQLPNEYTGCEEYQGFTIAWRTNDNSYSIFTASGARYPERYGNRADARRSIEKYILAGERA
jgi:hypothetical protein